MGKIRYAGGNPTMAVPYLGIALAEIAEGSLVKILEDGALIEFYVACHNYESGLNGAGRTLLVRKELREADGWDPSFPGQYAGCDQDVICNGEYKSLLDKKVQAAIGTTKFYCTNSYSDPTVVVLERSVFLLSAAELGKTSSNVKAEGSALPTASELLTASPQWTRTISCTNSNNAYYVRTVLGSSSLQSVAANSIAARRRPCFTLPSNARFFEDTMEFKGVL